MRRLTALATLVLLFAAGCTGSEDPGGDPSSEKSTGTPAPTAPLELTLEPPTGFTAASGQDREILFSDEHVSYVFYVAGDEDSLDKITVTSYLLSEGADTSTYDIQSGLVTDYFSQLGSTVSLDNFYPTIVHRQDGIYRYGEKDADGVEVKWRDYFLFSGPYLVNVTCQWDAHFAQIESACAEFTQSFPFPEEFAAAAKTS